MKKFVSLTFLCICCFLQATIDTVWLTWQRDPTTTMTVQWLSARGDEENQILFRLPDETDWTKAFGTHTVLPGTNNETLVHTVELFGLAPDMRYLFRINDEATERHFHTVPSTLSRPIRFAAGGDLYHTTIDMVERTHKQAAAANPDFALIGGDIAYSVSTKAVSMVTEDASRWKEFLKAWSDHMITPEGDLIPILPTVGNHDVIGGYRQPESRAPCYYTVFPMPGEKGFQVLDFGNYMSLFMLDSGHTHDIAGKQTAWLEEALSKRADMPHKVALYHVGAWPSVREIHSDVPSQVRKNWVPLFEKYKLDVAFEHHDHAYKRTHPIRNERIHENGVLYLGDGAWGAKPRKPRPASERWYLAKTDQKQHVIIAELTPYNRTYQATDAGGQIFDSHIQWIPFSAGPEPRDRRKPSLKEFDPSRLLPSLIFPHW